MNNISKRLVIILIGCTLQCFCIGKVWGQKSIKITTCKIYTQPGIQNPCAQYPSYWVDIVTQGYAIDSTNVVKVHAICGDGKDFIYQATRNYYNSGTMTSKYGNAWPHIYDNKGNYAIMIIAETSDGLKDTAYTSWNQIACGKIEGKPYIDANSNCILDTNESSNNAFYNMKVKVKSYKAGWEYSDFLWSGAYSIKVPLDSSTYSVEMIDSVQGVGKIATPVCPKGSKYIISNLSSQHNDFGYKTCVMLSKVKASKKGVCKPATIVFSIYHVGLIPNDTVRFKVYFGDGKDTVIVYPAVGLGSIAVNHLYTSPGSYSIQVIGQCKYLPTHADTLISYNAITITDSCALISGKVFFDMNGDCLFGSNDIPRKYQNIQLLDNGVAIKDAYSDNSGNYLFNVLNNKGHSYKVKFVQNPEDIYSLCPSSGEYDVSKISSSGNNFGLVCKQGYDLTGNLWGVHFRPGFNNGYIGVAIDNNRCEPVNATIKLIKSPLINIIGSTPPIDITHGDTLIWIVNNCRNFNAGLEVGTSANAVIGDSIHCTLIVEPIAGDSMPSDNIKHCVFPVRNSCDPNMKTAAANGNTAREAIAPGTKELTYTVFFQNTGNGAAYNIFIMDTLDKNIDPASVQIIASSHLMKSDLLSGNIFKFNFNNIMLADSFSNEPASHGFVSYKAKLKSGLPIGTTIKNTAYIYFDYNPAVVTNTVKNTLTQATITDIVKIMTGKGIQVNPNPSNDEMNIIIDNETKGGELKLVDIIGNIVLKASVTGTFMKLNTIQLPMGIYILSIDTGGKTYNTKVSVVH